MQVLTELTLIFIRFKLLQANLRYGNGGTLSAGAGRHLASLRHCVGLSWLTECLTGTFWLTDRDAGTKPLKPGLSRLKRDVWYAYVIVTVLRPFDLVQL